MKIGIGLPNQVPDVDPRLIPEWARRAEEAGFSSLGTVGRIAYPGVMDTVALAAAAGATERIGLLTNIVVAPAWPATLLAKELAGIDGVSGQRLTLGIGIGSRPDDFVAEDRPIAGRGPRLDRDLEIYRSVWRGAAIGGGESAAVPSGTREIPMFFGGFVPAALARMARWGQGYIGSSLPPEAVAETFDQAREAWTAHGREGAPRLIAIAYVALTDPAGGRGNVRTYYRERSAMAEQISAAVRTTPAACREAANAFEELGVEELIFTPATDRLEDLDELANAVL